MVQLFKVICFGLDLGHTNKVTKLAESKVRL